ncbi:exopolysaccharide biosynthesis protein [Noviherbaspirillum aridicola]|uniref:Protein exod n=1 Tax=Noviherbaspirillum aridicola TaxID=2849687 RepID=A0ABQ4Q1N2_9BURK|nr:exopolysaccharide biosynthesis protein [Noviherbaspirillum aridicola]GIZ51087.1 protein exod [Noviherbaspirillum aridicola]
MHNESSPSGKRPHPPELLSEKLTAMIEALPPSGVTLNHLLALAGRDGLMILTALLALVFLIPVSIPGVSTVFGGAILLIAVCRMRGRGLWLPERLRTKVIATDKLRPVLQRSLRWMGYLERVSEPHRLTWLVQGSGATMLNNAALVLGAVLLMAPFGLIPFSNTFPAVALMCLAIGLVQRDGVSIMLGHVANLATIGYFGLLLTGSGLAIREAFNRVAG